MCTDCEQNKNQALLQDVEFDAPNCDFTVEEVLSFKEKLESSENTFNTISTNAFLGLIETVKNNNRYLCIYQDRFQMLREAFAVTETVNENQPESGTSENQQDGGVSNPDGTGTNQ